MEKGANTIPRPDPNRFDAVIFDLDGVVYVTERPIPGVPETVRRVMETKHVLFLTNSPYRHRRTYIQILRKMGIPVGPDDILTSAYGIVLYIREHFKGRLSQLSGFVIGSEGLHKELSETDLTILSTEDGADADLVVVGLSLEFDWKQMAAATLAIDRGASFIASDQDPTFPTEDGPCPGTGAIVASIEYATGIKPVVIGKPKTRMFKLAHERLSERHHGFIDPQRILMVGDRLDTDIAGAQNAGFQTALALTGSMERGDLERFPFRPDFVLESAADLFV